MGRILFNFVLKRHFNYRSAVTRCIDASIVNEAIQSDRNSKINLLNAISQHNELIRVLKSKLNLDVTELPSDGFPDSVFIEDTAIIIDKTIFITNPGALSRRNETKRIKEYFQISNHYKEYNIIEQQSENSHLDGGDVLYTGGHEVLIGESSRTNRKGILDFHQAFPFYSIIVIPSIHTLQPYSNNLIRSNNEHMNPPTVHPLLHLKSVMSMCGPHTIAIGGIYKDVLKDLIENPSPSDMIEPQSSSSSSSAASTSSSSNNSSSKSIDYNVNTMKTSSHYTTNNTTNNNKMKYKFLLLPDSDAANCLYINNTIIRRTDIEYPDSQKTWDQYLHSSGIKQIQMSNSELAKADGALTCCCLLI